MVGSRIDYENHDSFDDRTGLEPRNPPKV